MLGVKSSRRIGRSRAIRLENEDENRIGNCQRRGRSFTYPGPANKNGGRCRAKDSKQSNYRYKVVTRGRVDGDGDIGPAEHLVRAPCKLVSLSLSPLFLSFSCTFLPRVRVARLVLRPLLSHSVHAPLISRLADRPRETDKKPRVAREQRPIP